jgi:hypothetical protein
VGGVVGHVAEELFAEQVVVDGQVHIGNRDMIISYYYCFWQKEVF